MHLDPQWLVPGAGGTLFLTKLFLNFARSMPPPPASCGFWCRWSFDFIQAMADNADRHGAVRGIGTIDTTKDSVTTTKAHTSTEPDPTKLPVEHIPDGVDSAA